MLKQNSNNKKKPWLDRNGQPLSTDELKSISRKWGPSMWEYYLSSIEVEQTEFLLEDPNSVDDLSYEEYKNFACQSMEKKDFPNLRIILEKVIHDLPKKQSQVLHHIFWEGLSMSEISKKYEVSRTAIQRTKERALRRAEKLLFKLFSKKKKYSQEEIDSWNKESDDKLIAQ